MNHNLAKSHDLLKLDLNSCDIDVESDTVRPAPPCETKTLLPGGWKNRPLRVSLATPETNDGGLPMELAADQFSADGSTGIMSVRTPSFSTFLQISIQPRPVQGKEKDGQTNP